MKLLNIQHPIIFVSILAVLSAAILLTIFFAASRVNFTAEKFFESNKLFRNPYCGFYHIMGYTLSDDYIPTDSLPYRSRIGLFIYLNGRKINKSSLIY